MLNAIRAMHFVKSEENQNIRGPMSAKLMLKPLRFSCVLGVFVVCDYRGHLGLFGALWWS